MQLKALQPFSLTGVSALSLGYGHRTFVDLNLFNHKKFDQEPIVKALKKEFGKGYNTESKTVRRGIFCYLDDI